MKAIKKITALVLVALMTLSLSACIHKKDEIAVTVGDVEFTSAYYMCTLIAADSEAKQKINEDTEQLTEAEANGTEDIDYYTKKIEKKSYEKWVKDRTIELLEKIAAYKTACKEKKLELTDEQEAEVAQSVAYYWDSYGYSQYFEPNGVSRATYAQYTEDAYYSSVYFDSIYAKGGTKEISTENVNKEIGNSYILIDEISIAYEENATDDQKAKNKQTLEGYAADIKNGKKTFIDVYKAHNEVKDEETETGETDEVKPVNTYAAVLGKEGTNFESTYYDTFVKYEYDVPQVIDLDDDSGVALVIKRDIFKDQYFVDYIDTHARHTIADEDFEKHIKDYSEKLKTKINNYAVDQFKVKKIIVP